MFVCLFVLRLNIPVNSFSVMAGQSHRLGITSTFGEYYQYFLAQGYNTAEVGFEPMTSRSGVRYSTTEPPRSPLLDVKT